MKGSPFIQRGHSWLIKLQLNYKYFSPNLGIKWILCTSTDNIICVFASLVGKTFLLGLERLFQQLLTGLLQPRFAAIRRCWTRAGSAECLMLGCQTEQGTDESFRMNIEARQI